MALDTYDNLCAEVALWLNRQDLTSQIPTFVRLLEAQINRKLRVREMETRSTSAVDTGVDEPQFLALPSDYLGMKQVQISTDQGPKILDFASSYQLDQLMFERGNVAGRPTLYSIVGSELKLGPTPDDAYPVELIYHARVPYLGASQASNWVLEAHPDLYLYGTLMQAAPYLHNDERVAVWDGGVQSFLDDISVADERSRAGSTPLKMRIKPYGGSLATRR